MGQAGGGASWQDLQVGLGVFGSEGDPATLKCTGPGPGVAGPRSRACFSAAHPVQALQGLSHSPPLDTFLP